MISNGLFSNWKDVKRSIPARLVPKNQTVCKKIALFRHYHLSLLGFFWGYPRDMELPMKALEFHFKQLSDEIYSISLIYRDSNYKIKYQVKSSAAQVVCALQGIHVGSKDLMKHKTSLFLFDLNSFYCQWQFLCERTRSDMIYLHGLVKVFYLCLVHSWTSTKSLPI